MAADATADARSPVNQLAARYANLVYRAAVRRMGGEGRGAEDVAQAVFLIALQKANTGHLPEEPRMAGWLLQITRYAAQEARRAQTRRRHHERQVAAQHPEARATPDPDSLLAAVDDALLKLPAFDRELIARRYLQNQPVNHLAAALNIPENTASQRLGRALEKLRKLLARQSLPIPAAGLTTLMLAESAKSAPASLLAAATTGTASAKAVTITKGASVMMRLATLKTATLAGCSLLILLAAAGITLMNTAKAQSPAPAPSAPSAVVPASAPAAAANDPRQLFMDTLHDLQAAKHISMEVVREERSFAAEPIASVHDQASVNAIQPPTTESIAIERPGKLYFLHSGPAQTADATVYAFQTILDQSSLLLASRHGDAKPWMGRVGAVQSKTADDILRSPVCNVALAPELPLLLDSQADSRFFQFATDWKWLGAASDLGVKVWRVQFTDVQRQPRSWELWISQAAPHHFTRIVVSGPADYGIIDVDAAGEFHNDRNYKTMNRVELRVTNSNTTAPIPSATFARPQGDFREEPFAQGEWATAIGEVVPLPILDDSAGKTVDLSKLTAPIVLDFWFAACGPCVEATPRIEAITDEFARQGVRLYGINAADDSEQIKQAQAEHGWNHMTTLMDEDQAFQKQLSVTSFPTVMVIAPGGKLLYRDGSIGPAALPSLRAVLQKATVTQRAGK